MTDDNKQPQAIRSALDVYGENARKVVAIESPQFGRVMTVCVGAMMVGSIRTTVQEGQAVVRGEELGYFAFGGYLSVILTRFPLIEIADALCYAGGSTIVLLFEKGVVDWDEDLVVNGRAALETLVRVGMGIGRCRRAVGAGAQVYRSS